MKRNEVDWPAVEGTVYLTACAVLVLGLVAYGVASLVRAVTS